MNNGDKEFLRRLHKELGASTQCVPHYGEFGEAKFAKGGQIPRYADGGDVLNRGLAGKARGGLSQFEGKPAPVAEKNQRQFEKGAVHPKTYAEGGKMYAEGGKMRKGGRMRRAEGGEMYAEGGNMKRGGRCHKMAEGGFFGDLFGGIKKGAGATMNSLSQVLPMVLNEGGMAEGGKMRKGGRMRRAEGGKMAEGGFLTGIPFLPFSEGGMAEGGKMRKGGRMKREHHSFGSVVGNLLTGGGGLLNGFGLFSEGGMAEGGKMRKGGRMRRAEGGKMAMGGVGKLRHGEIN